MDARRETLFGTFTPVYEALWLDRTALDDLCQFMTLAWADECRDQGGIPIGEPTVTTEPNPTFGQLITSDDGTKYPDPFAGYVFVRGRAMAPWGK